MGNHLYNIVINWHLKIILQLDAIILSFTA